MVDLSNELLIAVAQLTIIPASKLDEIGNLLSEVDDKPLIFAAEI